MSAAVETSSDVEVVEALDFEPNVACDPMPPFECSNPAVVYVVCRGCRDARPCCAHHLSLLRGLALIVEAMMCAVCGRAGALDFVVEFVPVKGGA